MVDIDTDELRLTLWNTESLYLRALDLARRGAGVMPWRTLYLATLEQARWNADEPRAKAPAPAERAAWIEEARADAIQSVREDERAPWVVGDSVRLSPAMVALGWPSAPGVLKRYSPAETDQWLVAWPDGQALRVNTAALVTA